MRKKQPSNDDAAEGAAPSSASPKRPGKRRLLVGVALAVVGGGGVAGALYAQERGYVRLPYLGDGEDPNRPHLVMRDDEPGAGYSSRPDEQPADPRRYKASYYSIGKEFTSNLNDGQSFVQVGLGVSTYYDERVFVNVQRHEMAVRSAVLMTLASQDPGTLSTPNGKVALQTDLKKAITDVLRAKEGFGGIDGVYFTSFVMQ
jgi:flagellar FliL protein